MHVSRAGSSVWYYDHVMNYFSYKDTGASYRLFMLPGVGHCGGGPGADGFGGAEQKGLDKGGFGQSLSFDTQHDMVLATIAWVEKGVLPKKLIGVKYVNSNITLGTRFSRLFCPYPQVYICAHLPFTISRYLCVGSDISRGKSGLG
jgi:feruloyl esterase